MFAVGLIVMTLLLLTAHWFPWPVKLHRLGAYTLGVAAILAGTGVWLQANAIWRGLVVFAVVGGAVTGLAYLVDYALRARIARQVADERDYRGRS